MTEPSTVRDHGGTLRFGVFELDIATLELKKHSRPLRVRPQSLKLLALLVQRPGELITRDDIRHALWGDDTFVDYEQGVNHSIKELRAAMGDSAISPRFIETLPRRGYRFIAPVEGSAPALTSAGRSAEPPEAAVAPPAETVHPATTPHARRAVLIAVLVTGVVVVSVAAWLWIRPSGDRTVLTVPATLSVQAFTATGVDDAFGAGLSNAISARLNVQDRMTVTTGGGAESGLVLDGDISRDGENFVVVVWLRRDGETVWSNRLQVRADQLFSIENVVADRIVDALDLRLVAAEQERLTRRYTENAAAYEEYLRGTAALVLYTPDGTRRAVKAFEAALERDASFVLARAGLAMACADMFLRFATADEVESWGQRAEEMARIALELDPGLADAHLARAAVARKREFDWSVVLSASERALVLNPNLPQAHYFRAAALYHLGYMEDAIVEVENGRKLRGADLIEPVRTEGLVALFSGNFAPARTHLEEASRLSSQQISDVYLALAHYYSGSPERAESMLTALSASASASTASRASAALAGMLGARGDTKRARAEIERVLARPYRDHHVAYSVGVAYAQLSDFAAAGRWLATAIDTGFPCVVFYEQDPLLKDFRQRPEFRDVLSHARERRELLAVSR